jgi:N-formylglutamate deformylase
MQFAEWLVDAAHPVMATAVHHGHDLRPEVREALVVEPSVRLREEDPWTSEIAAGTGSWVMVHRSRFEVDLNRDRPQSVYRRPEDAWGLDLWAGALDEAIAERSRQLYDAFYDDLEVVLDRLVAEHKGFVLYDVHSYNHRRGGPDAEPGPAAENPVVNLGTGSLPDRWRPVAGAFLESVAQRDFQGGKIDARADVRFKGGHLAAWVHDRYGEFGCALAIEFKKVFMDEWTNEVDTDLVEDLAGALRDSIGPVWEAHLLCR